jgi:hypothetical protein
MFLILPGPGKGGYPKLAVKLLFLVDPATNILLMLLAAFLATAFIFELFRRQYWRAGTRPQFVLFNRNRNLVSLLLWHSRSLYPQPRESNTVGVSGWWVSLSSEFKLQLALCAAPT